MFIHIYWIYGFGWVWFYGISTIVGYLIPNPVFTYISNIWFVNTFWRYTQLNDETVLFLIIHFNKVNWSQALLCITNSSIKHQSFVYIQFECLTALVWPIDRTQSNATTWGLSGPRSNDNEGVLCIPQSSSITWISPSDCLVSHLGYSLGLSYPPADDAVCVFYSPN